MDGFIVYPECYPDTFNVTWEICDEGVIIYPECYPETYDVPCERCEANDEGVPAIVYPECYEETYDDPWRVCIDCSILVLQPCKVSTETTLVVPQEITHYVNYADSYARFEVSYEGNDTSSCDYSVTTSNSVVQVQTISDNS